MKRILALLCALMLLAVGASAVAEQDAIMTVAFCENWVSLRAAPNTGSERLAQVPLGATVMDCAQVSDTFTQCTYQGMTGYILTEYLKAPALAANADGLNVIAVRGYKNDGEVLEVTCTDIEGNVCWERTFESPYATELDCTDAFLGGTADDPMLMVHVSGVGLRALDLHTGEERWMVSGETVNLGASLSAAVGEDGTAYIGGYYGPDPVAISATGEVLWQAQTERDAFWLYEIELTDEGIVATYDFFNDPENRIQICYGYDGQELWAKEL